MTKRKTAGPTAGMATMAALVSTGANIKMAKKSADGLGGAKTAAHLGLDRNTVTSIANAPQKNAYGTAGLVGQS